MTELLQLYPAPMAERPLTNLYLQHDLRQYSRASGHAFIVANFIASLDGRIAVPHPHKPGLTVPRNIANDRDWRLFQELAAQSDLIISSGRYLRDWADGRAQEILQIDDPRFADLRAWRAAQGLKPQPDIAILSNSLRFPIPEVLTAGGRRVVIFTKANPDPSRVQEIEAQAGQVIVAGNAEVEGERFAQAVTKLGYQLVYSAAGPQILHMLLRGNALHRLYLTHASRLIGGSPFATIVDGPLLETAVDLRLHTLYYDPQGLDGTGQLFAAYHRPQA